MLRSRCSKGAGTKGARLALRSLDDQRVPRAAHPHQANAWPSLRSRRDVPGARRRYGAAGCFRVRGEEACSVAPKSRGIRARSARFGAYLVGKGCGFLGLGDCWSCLRSDNALGATIAAIEERKAKETGATALACAPRSAGRRAARRNRRGTARRSVLRSLDGVLNPARRRAAWSRSRG